MFGWQHLLAPKNASKYAYMLYPVVNAEAVNTGKKPLDALGVASLDDGRTFQVELTSPTPYFLQLLTHYTAYPAPKHAVEEYGKNWVKLDNIVTNGAFTPEEWVSQSRISVSRNPEYYDADEIAGRGQLLHDRGSQRRRLALSLRRAGHHARIFLQHVRHAPGGTARGYPHGPLPGSYYYVFNHREGHPTADPKVREALSLVVRRKVLSEQIMGGTFLPSRSFVPEASTTMTSSRYRRKAAWTSAWHAPGSFSRRPATAPTTRFTCACATTPTTSTRRSPLPWPPCGARWASKSI